MDNWKENKPENTIRIYESCYNAHLVKLKNKTIDEITEDDIQNLISFMISKGRFPSTINVVKMVMKPLLEINDIHLNWKKIIRNFTTRIQTHDELDIMPIDVYKVLKKI